MNSYHPLRIGLAVLALTAMVSACGAPTASPPTATPPQASNLTAVPASLAPPTATHTAVPPTVAPAMSTATEAPTATPTSTAPPAPNPGVLRVAIPFMPTLDPLQSYNIEQIVLGNVCERLLDHNPPGSADAFTYKLATSLEHSDDGLTWTAVLRSGVQFHDGTAFTAAAVKATIEAVKAHGAFAGIYAALDSIDAPDAQTVVFHLSSPIDLALTLAGQYGTQIVSETALAAVAADKNAYNKGLDGCTGPYAVQSATADTVELAPYAGYWNPSDLPGRPNSVIVSVVAAADEAVQLSAHDIDLAFGLSNADTVSFQVDPNFAPFTGTSHSGVWLFLNTKHSPLDDVAVRQAIAAAIDTPAILQALTDALGVPFLPSNGPVPDGLYPASADVPLNAFDLATAQQLLAGTSQAGGFSLRLLYSKFDAGAPIIVPLITQNLAQVGVTVEAQGLGGPDLVAALNSTDPAVAPDLFLGGSFPFGLDGSREILTAAFHSAPLGTRNLSAYNNPAYDTLIDAGLAAEVSDPAAALSDFVQAETLLVVEAPAIFLYVASANYPVPTYLQGFTHSADYWNFVDFYQMHYSP